MDKSWIKLFRRINNHTLASDMTALGVFIWLLINVNRQTGKMIIGRFATSRQVGLNPSTFRDVISRLEKTHKVLTTASTTGRYTEISVLNWAKYQGVNATNDRLDDKRTTQLETKDIVNIVNTKTLSNTVIAKKQNFSSTPKNPISSYKREMYNKFIQAGLPSPEGFTNQEEYLSSLSEAQSWIYAMKFGGIQ